MKFEKETFVVYRNNFVALVFDDEDKAKLHMLNNPDRDHFKMTHEKGEVLGDGRCIINNNVYEIKCNDKSYEELQYDYIMSKLTTEEKDFLVERSKKERSELVGNIKERNELIDTMKSIFRWLLGIEGEFPKKSDSDSIYYWRKTLRKKLSENVIIVEKVNRR